MIFDATGSRCVVTGDASMASDASGIVEPLGNTGCNIQFPSGAGVKQFNLTLDTNDPLKAPFTADFTMTIE